MLPSQIVEEEALIKNNNTCKDFLIEAMKYHLLPADQRHLINTDRTRPRTPISIPKVYEHIEYVVTYTKYTCLVQSSFIFLNKQSRCNQCEAEPVNLQVMIVVGGQAPKAIRSVECYDFQEDRWYQVADLPSRRCRAGQFVQSVHEGQMQLLMLDMVFHTTFLVCRAESAHQWKDFLKIETVSLL